MEPITNLQILIFETNLGKLPYLLPSHCAMHTAKIIIFLKRENIGPIYHGTNY